MFIGGPTWYFGVTFTVHPLTLLARGVWCLLNVIQVTAPDPGKPYTLAY